MNEPGNKPLASSAASSAASSTKGVWRIVGNLPFLAVIFLNAFVDLGHKITIQNTIFKVYDGGEQVILTAIVNALILLPFILLFSPSGFVSDKYAKTTVMKTSALAAVIISCFITLSYILGWFWLAFALTFILAVQSAFYGPAKLAYIKALYGESNLTEANGITQAAAMIAILLGTFVFSLFFEMSYSETMTTKAEILQNCWWLGVLLIAFSVMELKLVNKLPVKEQGNSDLRFDIPAYFKTQLLQKNIQHVSQSKIIIWAIVGLCVFWSAGQVMLATFPAFAKEQIGIVNTVVLQLILACTGVGIIIGAFIAGKLSKGSINTKLISVGAVGIVFGLLLLPFLNSAVLMGFVFALIGVCGGLFVVPLNALIQYHSSSVSLGRVLAGKNFFQNILMLLFLVLTAWFAYQGLSTKQLLIALGVFALVACPIAVVLLNKALREKP